MLSQWTAAGKAISLGVDKYQLTTAALASYRVCLGLNHPKPTLSARLDDMHGPALALEDRTTLELWLLLRRDGWQERTTEPMTAKQLQALKAYRTGDRKVLSKMGNIIYGFSDVFSLFSRKLQKICHLLVMFDDVT